MKTAVGNCASVYQGKIMQEILEFSEIEIPEKNPNPVNDIYKKNGAEGAVSALVSLLLTSIACSMGGVVLLSISIYNIVALGERESVDYWGGIAFGLCVCVGILWTKVNVRDIYRTCGYRKKIIKKGTAYPAWLQMWRTIGQDVVLPDLGH